jgi:DNA-binding NarL/FixJ family response regulator
MIVLFLGESFKHALLAYRMIVLWPVSVEWTKNDDEDERMLRSLQAGVRGYLLKDSGLETVLQAIERAARGEFIEGLIVLKMGL